LSHLDGGREYDEYVFGSWKSLPLWNGTGSVHDTLLREFDHAPVPTGLAQDFPVLASFVESHFAIEQLRWARLFVLERGVLLPHRDYLELKKGFTRVHVPLQTSPACLHSEEDEVFHMRVGEVWFLEASNVHSACNPLEVPRVTLCLDFTRDKGLESIFRSPVRQENGPACMIDRPSLTTGELAEIVAQAATMTMGTFRDVAAAMSMVHFGRRVHPAAMFGWLVESARRAGDPRLVDRALSLRALALGEAIHSIASHGPDDDASTA